MWTCAQIVAQACQDALVPAWTAQAGAKLQMILDELCETYNFEGAKTAFYGSFNPALNVPTTPPSQDNPNLVPGNGPYALPSDYLRMRKQDFVYWFNGVPYPLVAYEEYEFDRQVQQVGIASLPTTYYTDLSDPNNPVFYIYPPPNAAYPYQGKCQIRMPAVGSNTSGTAIASNGWDPGPNPPQSSSVVPWFPNTSYLLIRLTGEMMRSTGDQRWRQMLGKNRDGTGAQDILERITQAVDDKWKMAQRITLDQRHFGPRWAALPDSKNLFG